MNLYDEIDTQKDAEIHFRRFANVQGDIVDVKGEAGTSMLLLMIGTLAILKRYARADRQQDAVRDYATALQDLEQMLRGGGMAKRYKST